MERSGRGLSITTASLDDLAPLYDRDGPFLTVWATTPASLESAGPRAAAQWNDVQRQIVHAGAPQELADRIEPVFTEAYRHGEGLVLIADAAGIGQVEHLPEPPRADLVRWAPLPSPAPVIEHRQARVPHIVVLADRTGAEIYSTVNGSSVAEVSGADASMPITKSAPGGWSQRRYQQRAENTWEQNAKAVADEVAAAAEQADARLVVVAGDVRAVQLLREHLPRRVDELVHEVAGGRAADGSAADTAAEIDALVRTAVAAETVTVLRQFEADRGRGDRAVLGAEPTLNALAAAQVDVLLAHDDPGDDRQAWFVPGEPAAALEPSQLGTVGAPLQGRLTDVALRAAVLTGATIRVVPSAGPLGGELGALLRWSPNTCLTPD